MKTLTVESVILMACLRHDPASRLADALRATVFDPMAGALERASARRTRAWCERQLRGME